jgi:probable HAF family extracellular repeat protein
MNAADRMGNVAAADGSSRRARWAKPLRRGAATVADGTGPWGRWAKPLRRGAATVATGALAAAAPLALAGPAGATSHRPTAYAFRTLDNRGDLTFNQLLGINNHGVIAGYFGSGAQGHPNKGYRLVAPYHQGNYVNENFPGSVQTQVTGLNDNGVSVGFWSSQNTASGANNNFGFYLRNGHFHTVDFPTGDNASPPVDQLLGVNDSGVAVGFYTNAQGSNRGFEYNIGSHRFSRVLVPGAPGGTAGPSLTATAINNNGTVAGFYTASGGATDSFVKTRGGRFISLAVPGASMTQALGINDHGEVVGVYTVGSATMHGFTWRNGHFTTVDDPHGRGTTTINGVNDAGDLVGFYTDAAGNTDGLLATP